jgi:hypothetical protein
LWGMSKSLLRGGGQHTFILFILFELLFYCCRRETQWQLLGWGRESWGASPN